MIGDAVKGFEIKPARVLASAFGAVHSARAQAPLL